MLFQLHYVIKNVLSWIAILGSHEDVENILSSDMEQFDMEWYGEIWYGTRKPNLNIYSTSTK
jgi:hypothetical protein